jgi:precorrin-6B methylase 2
MTCARALAGVLVLTIAASGCQARRAPDTPEPYTPAVGQPGRDAVWVPTSEALVEKMLDLAQVTAEDVVMDLGSGDGRTVVAAARRGARAIGVEFNPDLVELSRRRARAAGVDRLATFVEGDMFQADISKATVLALFLLPSNLEQLKDKFLALPPGTRIVLNTLAIEGWEADVTESIEGDCVSWCTALLHIVPAQVGGAWRFEGGEMAVAQDFQKLQVTLTAGGQVHPPATGRMNGRVMQFSAAGRTYSGEVDGGRITGTATPAAGGPSRPWQATRVPPSP